MPFDPDAAQICYLEVARLRELAMQPEYADIREEIFRVIEQYEDLARLNGVKPAAA